MSNIGGSRPKGTTGRRVEVNEDARGAAASATTALVAREAAVLAREQAADQRQEAADLRDEVADQREEVMTAAAERRTRSETELLEANEHLVVAAIHSQTMTEVAEHATSLMSLKAERDF